MEKKKLTLESNIHSRDFVTISKDGKCIIFYVALDGVAETFRISKEKLREFIDG